MKEFHAFNVACSCNVTDEPVTRAKYKGTLLIIFFFNGKVLILQT